MEERIPGEICSWIIISRRKMSVEISLGDIFSGENCESLEKNCLALAEHAVRTSNFEPMS